MPDLVATIKNIISKQDTLGEAFIKELNFVRVLEEIYRLLYH